MEIPLAIKSGDYNSTKNRGLLVNMLVETNKAQDFVAVRRAEGLELSVSTPNGEPVRSNIHKNGGYKYFVAGTVLYRWDSSTPTSLGTVGGSGRATILSNSVPGNNQILVLNGSGDGYIYDNSGLNQITDADFYSTTSATILNERFWFSRDDTNEFFASDQSDGTSYNPLSFGTAEWKPDKVVIVVSKGSALWVVGQTTMEYWQSFDDAILPVRSVRGASKDIGILAKTSFAELDEQFAFLADDSNVMLVNGTNVTQISDLDFQIKIRGDGTAQNPGLSASEIQECVGYFVDTPQHKIYYLNFPSANYTWAYDTSTSLSFTRESLDGAAWRGLYSITDSNQVFVGDRLDGSIWLYSMSAKGEGDDYMAAVMRTPTISFKKNMFINSIEIEMEVAVAETASQNPKMIVSNTKDGGKTWINHSEIELGKEGVYSKRVIIRNFGRLVRKKDFALELRVTDGVRVQIYKIEADIEEGHAVIEKLDMGRKIVNESGQPTAYFEDVISQIVEAIGGEDAESVPDQIRKSNVEVATLRSQVKANR